MGAFEIPSNIFLKGEVFLEANIKDADAILRRFEIAMLSIAEKLNQAAIKETRNNCRFLEVGSMELVKNRGTGTDQTRNEEYTIYFLFNVVHSEYFDDENFGRTVVIDCPIDTILRLPTEIGMNKPFSWSMDEISAFAFFSAYVLHELGHAFGAFHSSRGIMSRVHELVNFTDPDFDIEKTMDESTFAIFTEWMKKRKPSVSTMEAIKLPRQLIQIKSNIPIMLHCFVLKGKYVRDMFENYHESDHELVIKIKVPDVWDTLVVMTSNSTMFVITEVDGELVPKMTSHTT